MTEPGPILDARGVHKSFGALEALKGVDLTVKRVNAAIMTVGPMWRNYPPAETAIAASGARRTRRRSCKDTAIRRGASP